MSGYHPLYDASYALIIGIDTYSDARFVTLGNAETDARSMAELLSASPYNFGVTQLLGYHASRQAILDALFGLRRVEADDRLLIYFAGHGYTLFDRVGNETGYLAAADTIPEKDYTALAIDDVIALTRHSPAKHIAFIFDACYSGQALGLTRAPATSSDKLLVRRAYQVMSAGAGDQPVSDYRSMTGVLINALQSGVMNQDGLVTFSEIGLYLQQTITAESHMTQIPQFGHLRGSQGGEFVFYQDRTVRLPRDVVAMLASERAVARQGAVVALIEIARGDDPGLALLARQNLMHLSTEDPDERIRSAASRYLMDTQDQLLEVDIRPAERARPPVAAQSTPPPPSAPLYEQVYAPSPDAYPPAAVVAKKRGTKPARRRRDFRLVWIASVGVVVCAMILGGVLGLNLLVGQINAGYDASTATHNAAASQTIVQTEGKTDQPPSSTPSFTLPATKSVFVPTVVQPTSAPPAPTDTPTTPPPPTAPGPTLIPTSLPPTPTP